MDAADRAEVERARRLLGVAREAVETADAALLAMQMRGDVPPVEPPVSPPPAPAEPPVPPSPPVGIVATRLSTDGNAPTTTPDQVLVLDLHGSSGAQGVHGDQWSAPGGGRFGFASDAVFRWAAIRNGATQMRLQPHDSVPLDAGRGRMETYHLGYTIPNGEGRILHLYTERRIDALLQWAAEQYPQASRTKRVAYGESMGAWGVMTYAMRRPQQFAAVFASRPRWRFAEPGRVSCPDWKVGYGIGWTAENAPPVAEVGGTVYTHLDLISYAANSANELPWVGWCMGRNDGFAPFSDSVAAVAALRATGRGFAFAWNNGDHSGGNIIGQITASYPFSAFELGKGYPIFSAHSLDKDPAVDLAGGINVGLSFRNVVESADAWSCEVTHITSACTVQVKPYSKTFTATVAPQTVSIPAANAWVPVSFSKAAAPAPVEPPAPSPAGPRNVTTQPVNMAARVTIDNYFGGGRYERYKNPGRLWRDPTATVTIQGWDANGSPRNLGFGEYVLLLDGRPSASLTITAPQTRAEFRGVDVSAIPQGYVRIDVQCPGVQTCPAWYAYRWPAGEPVRWPESVPVTTGTYGLTHQPTGGPVQHVYATVPARWAPTALPMPARDYPAFSEVPGRDILVQQQLAICRPDDVDRLHVMRAGYPTTAGQQAYFESDLYEKLPRLALLDGPRGVGCTVMPTHCQVGRKGGAYVTTPYSLQHIDPTGNVKTLAGYRHKAPPTYYGETPELELVGDWSAIPAERHGFQGVWGFCWDIGTLAVDEAAEAIPNGATDEKPHLVGPLGFIADYKRNRVCGVRFDPRSHQTVAKVTEHVTGLAAPWDVAYHAGLLYISEREGNRVTVCNAETGATVRTIPWQKPEGLYVLDDWLYIGSSATRTVQRLKLTEAGAVAEPVCKVRWTINSRYVKLAVSDGTFGPKGLIGVVTWDNVGYGMPFLFTPDGKELDGWVWGSGTRKGPAWLGQNGLPAPGYPSCIGFGNGRMLCGTSQEGLMQMSRALPTDATTSDMVPGLREWVRRGYQLTHGHGGFGFFGLPLPWGEHPDIDAFLRAHGHQRAAA